MSGNATYDPIMQRNSVHLAASDALVFFGATGDLAHKQIFPALQSMIRHGKLNVPVIGVAKSGWSIEQLCARARDSLVQYGGGVDEASVKEKNDENTFGNRWL